MAVAPSAQPLPLPRSTTGAGWPVRLVPLLTAHLVVALVALVAIGGATRVMQAGLACPDWPLCYGVLWPGRQWNLQVFLEWFHRLDAFLVGVALLLLFALSLRFRARFPAWLPWGAGLALALVAVQGGLGALTVLSQLAAPTVTLHLAAALSLVLLLSAMHQGLEHRGDVAAVDLPRWWSPSTSWPPCSSAASACWARPWPAAGPPRSALRPGRAATGCCCTGRGPIQRR